MNPVHSLTRVFDTIHTWGRYVKLRLYCRIGLGRRAEIGSEIAIIAWTFPPAYSGGVFRPVSWTRHFANAEQASIVLAHTLGETFTEAGAALLGQVPPSVRVLRHPSSPSLSPFRRLTPQLDGGFPECLDLVTNAIANYGANRPSVVIASGPPFSSFVAGYLLAQYWSRPLIVDYRDEWSECPFPFVSSGPFDRAWEEKVNAFATSIVCVSHSQLEHHLRAFPQVDSQKCVVIPNGWEPDESESLPRVATSNRDKLRIGFAGTLGDHTLPNGFLDVLAELISRRLIDRDIELHFLGSKSPKAVEALAAFSIPGVIHSVGLKAKRDAHLFMRNMDILVLLNEPAMARYVPGKLYDYLASGRPILAYGRGGETERILKETQAGVVASEGNAEELAHALGLLALMTSSENTALTDWLARHTRARAADRILALARSASDQN